MYTCVSEYVHVLSRFKIRFAATDAEICARFEIVQGASVSNACAFLLDFYGNQTHVFELVSVRLIVFCT